MVKGDSTPYPTMVVTNDAEKKFDSSNFFLTYTTESANISEVKKANRLPDVIRNLFHCSYEAESL